MDSPPPVEKVTLPYLTKYEKAQVLCKRILELSLRSPPLVATSSNEPGDIALAELEARKIPYVVRRYLSNGRYEDWRLEELAVVD